MSSQEERIAQLLKYVLSKSSPTGVYVVEISWAHSFHQISYTLKKKKRNR